MFFARVWAFRIAGWVLVALVDHLYLLLEGLNQELGIGGKGGSGAKLVSLVTGLALEGGVADRPVNSRRKGFFIAQPP